MKLRVIEICGGIGACTQAIKKLGIEEEIVDYIEIDKYAVKSFNAINGTNFEPQDLTKWDKDLKDIDLILGGTPCVDFSIAGKQKGGDKESGTRSSLMWRQVRIIQKLKPKYVIWENVKNVLSPKHIHNFHQYIDELNAIGYNSYSQVLNAKHYGIPQNRERIFCVSIRKDIDDNSFTFPPKQELKIFLKDILEQNVDEKYYLPENIIHTMNKTKEETNGYPRKERFEQSTDRDIANSVTTRAGARPTDNFIKNLGNNTNEH